MDAKTLSPSESTSPLLIVRPIDWGEGVTESDSFALPVGTVTLVLADIVGSTRHWETDPDAMKNNIHRFDSLVDRLIPAHGGVQPRDQGEGDSFLAAFSRASDALNFALELQQALAEADWDSRPLAVRLALHTGEVQLRDDANYIGQAVNRCARIRSAGHGGQTLLSQSTYDLVLDRLPGDASLLDLGTHRLRDLSRPEHIYQLNHPSLASEFPPLKSLDTLPNNLPVQLSSFVGRNREITQIKGLLAESRLVTLTGSGGAGKTRLAVQVAAECLDDFEGGVWFVELASVKQPDALVPAVVDALGQADSSMAASPTLATVSSFFKAKKSLIVLDNCEHLIDACADLADSLVKQSPELIILATSREPLGVDGETTWRVPSLSLPEEIGHATVESVSQYEAVQLFIDRAKRSRADFQITEQNAGFIAEITFKLDGIPLAIELAAARSRVLTPQQILDGLTDRFALLAGRSRTSLPRQQTLLASVDWSYRLLTAPEQLLFRRLSMFVGGFDLSSADGVCSGDGLDSPQILDLLSLLVDKSLVIAEETPGGFRYRLLETVRQFAADRLREADETETIAIRHAEHFLASVSESVDLGAFLNLSFDDLERLSLDLPNFEAAYRSLLALGRKEEALELLTHYGAVAQISGHGSSIVERIDELLKSGSHSDRITARALMMQGAATNPPSRFPEAKDRMERAIKLFESIEERDLDPFYQYGVAGLALVAGYTTGPEEGTWAFEEAMRLAELTNSPALKAQALIPRGFLTSLHVDPTAGQALVDEGLRALPRDRIGAGGLLFQAALAARRTRNLTRALPLYEEAIPLLKRYPYKLWAQWGLDHAGNIAYELGDFEKARRYVDEGIKMSRKAGLTWGNFWSLLTTKAWLEEDEGNTDKARGLLEEVLLLIDKAGWSDLQHGRFPSTYLLFLGDLKQTEGLHREGLEIYQSALKMIGKWEPFHIETGELVHPPVGSCLRRIAVSQAATGHLHKAARLFGAAESRREIEKWNLARLEKRHAQATETVKAALPASLFETEWALGSSLTIEDMAAYGLGPTDTAVHSELVNALFVADDLDAGRQIDQGRLEEGVRELRKHPEARVPLARCLRQHARSAGADSAEDHAHEALALAVETGDMQTTAMALELLARFAAEAESLVESARLLAAASKLWDELGYMPTKTDRNPREKVLATTRSGLGAEDFAAAWNEGAAMSAEQATNYASKGRGERKRPSRGWESLTPAELQVAALVAQGLSNPQIAERLFIARKTVQHHVSNILAKLEVPSRAGIAAEAARHASSPR